MPPSASSGELGDHRARIRRRLRQRSAQPGPAARRPKPAGTRRARRASRGSRRRAPPSAPAAHGSRSFVRVYVRDPRPDERGDLRLVVARLAERISAVCAPSGGAADGRRARSPSNETGGPTVVYAPRSCEDPERGRLLVGRRAPRRPGPAPRARPRRGAARATRRSSRPRAARRSSATSSSRFSHPARVRREARLVRQPERLAQRRVEAVVPRADHQLAVRGRERLIRDDQREAGAAPPRHVARAEDSRSPAFRRARARPPAARARSSRPPPTVSAATTASADQGPVARSISDVPTRTPGRSSSPVSETMPTNACSSGS